MTKYKVLIVDDSSLIRNLIRDIFNKDSQFEVIGTASNGLEAVDLVLSLQPDLVTMDIEMPEMDGLTALQQIMNYYPVPIIMVSTYTEEGTEIAMQTIELGASDFFHKDLLFDKEREAMFVEDFLLRCKLAMRNKMTMSLDRTIQSNEQTNQMLMESFSHLLKIKEDLASASEDLQQVIRKQNTLILKFTKVEDRFIHTYCEGGLLQKFAIEARDVLGKDLEELFPKDLAEFQLPLYERAWNSNVNMVSFEMRWHGTKLFTQLTPVYREGRIKNVIAVSFDISAQEKVKEKMSYLVDYDHLTRLPNRTYLNQKLKETIEQDAPTKFALLVLDIDHLKLINDTYGHEVGDRLLQVVARRLKTCIKKDNYFVSRVGGDEFICLIPVSDREEIDAVADKLIHYLKQPIRMSGQDMYITFSVGISEYPDSGEDSETLYKYADTAKHSAKEHGGNQFIYWDAQLNEQFQRRMLIEKYLKKAIENNEFILQYQPQINKNLSAIVGFESLIRWNNPLLGLVSPGEFIPIAEETDLITEIGKWVLREACVLNKKLQLDGLPPFKIAVNLSSKQFLDLNLNEHIKLILEETQLEPQYLELEITESMSMDVDLTLKSLKSLKELGVYIAMDDFGTGYSSLSYLKEFPIDILKIDQSFVNGITTSSINSSIVKTIISMSQSLDLDVIAEGVEDEETLRLLGEYGCNTVQGYYYSKPVEGSKVKEVYLEIMEKHFREK